MLGLSTTAVRSVISGGSSEYEYQRQQQQYSSSEAFYFDYVHAKLCFRRSSCMKVVGKSAGCCEFGKKYRPIQSEDIIRDRTFSDCLLLQGMISRGFSRYESYYSSISTVVQRRSASNMYKAKSNIHNKRAQ